MPKALDLTGQKFGYLTALKKAPSKGKKTYWTCKCDCGNIKDIQTSHLTSGATQSCGCLKNEINSYHHNEIKTCVICGKEFVANQARRLYCFDCVPKGLSQTESAKIRSRLLKHKLIEYKGGKCEKCGYNKCDGALHFHHLDPTEKSFSISQINLGYITLEEITKEIDKCQLLCANCHAEIHWKD